MCYNIIMNEVEHIKKLFGSNTRTKLLGLFLNHPSESYYVREITRLIDEQINSVRRELTNLEDIGLIQKFEQQRKVYYRLDANSGLLQPLYLIFSEKKTVEADKSLNAKSGILESSSVDWLKEIANIKTSLKTIILSGILVDDQRSEFDMLLVGNNVDGQLSDWANRIELRLGKELRYVIFDQKDFNYRLSVKDRFVMNLLRGKHEVVFDESGKILEGE